jgi:glycosyltransferase involved in cell wall biosynthesis
MQVDSDVGKGHIEVKRLCVLISSHEFSPEQGSECAVGWNIVTRMAGYHDVTVLCADGPAKKPDSYREAVSRYFDRNGPIQGLRVVYVKQPATTLRYERINRRLMLLTKGVGWQFLYYFGLDAWHREAFRTAKDLGLNNFDLVHQLTPISFLRPGYFWRSNVPFFWGPLGGMYKVPGAFARCGGIISLLFETVRSANITRQVRRSRCFEGAVRKAEQIWTVTEDERCIVNGMAGRKAVSMVDTAPPSGIAGRVRQYDGRRPLRICWSGRHEARKALPLLLDALAQLNQERKIILDVLGEGPETRKWQAMANKQNLGNITWHGRLPYEEALNVMGQADVFVHSSFREAASMVVLEAMGWGLPVICHNACGMAVAVDDTCGIKVPFVNPETSIIGFRDALASILRDPGLVEQLSKGALRRASELSWDSKVKELAEAYSRIDIRKS